MTQSTAVTEELKKALSAEEGGRKWLRRLAVAGSLVLAIAAAAAWRAAHAPPPPAKYVSATVAAGDVVEKVQATGTVQPLLQVNVGAQVNGRVTNVPVDYNSVVHKGDVLAEIDPQIYGTQVSAQAASLLAQRAQLEQAKASMLSMKAQMETAKVALDRTQKLFGASLASKSDLDTAQGNYNSVQAQYDAAAANVESQQANIAAQAAQLNQSRTNLGYTKIYAPGDGSVGERQVRPGQLVSPGTQVIAFVNINRWVQANYKETQLTNVRVGDPAEIRVDQFPGQVFRGKVIEIAPASGSQFALLPPDNATGNFTKVVQRIPVKIALNDSNLAGKLRPGLSVTAIVRTRR